MQRSDRRLRNHATVVSRLMLGKPRFSFNHHQPKVTRTIAIATS